MQYSLARTEQGQTLGITAKMANRHGLIAGATGTGKTVTLRKMAEAFSDDGVPSFSGCKRRFVRFSKSGHIQWQSGGTH